MGWPLAWSKIRPDRPGWGIAVGEGWRVAVGSGEGVTVGSRVGVGRVRWTVALVAGAAARPQAVSRMINIRRMTEM
jgi:hypothetical protein